MKIAGMKSLRCSGVLCVVFAFQTLAVDVGLAQEETCTTTATIHCGETKSGTTVQPVDEHCYQFDAHIGDVVSITTVTTADPNGGFVACWKLYRPDGNEVYAYCGQSESGSLPSDGTVHHQGVRRGARSGRFCV